MFWELQTSNFSILLLPKCVLSLSKGSATNIFYCKPRIFQVGAIILVWWGRGAVAFGRAGPVACPCLCRGVVQRFFANVGGGFDLVGGVGGGGWALGYHSGQFRYFPDIF